MTERQRIIPIQPGKESPLRPAVFDASIPKPTGRVTDTRDRGLRDLRISVIDQCNLRCGYCMPREVFNRDYVFLSRQELLSFSEIERLTRAFVGLGVEKVRITGGEPLLRKQLETLVESLARLKTLENKPLELALTTNGLLLKEKAAGLVQAGLHRVTVSLDALDPEVFQAMGDTPEASPEQVLAGIEAALSAGLKVKANMVVQRGVNDSQILPMARAFRELGATLRFIEFMDVGSSNGWDPTQVMASEDILELIGQVFPLEPYGRDIPSEVSERWRYTDGRGEVGFISSVSKPFCSDCSRARISAEGGLYTCLFASTGVDLRALLRSEPSDELVGQAIAQLWQQRTDRYSELRGELMKKGPVGPKVEMSYIGG
ncbi:MAG: molybdenum cofactor biosynthesis protein [Pseudomonadota bacterium]|jgi:cyclic pyranopterin phosphate synthase